MKSNQKDTTPVTELLSELRPILVDTLEYVAKKHGKFYLELIDMTIRKISKEMVSSEIEMQNLRDKITDLSVENDRLTVLNEMMSADHYNAQNNRTDNKCDTGPEDQISLITKRLDKLEELILSKVNNKHAVFSRERS